MRSAPSCVGGPDRQTSFVGDAHWERGRRRPGLYVDGFAFRVIENTHWHNASHLNLNSEIKETWMGLPGANELPGTFQIDYVRSWRRVEPGDPPVRAGARPLP